MSRKKNKDVVLERIKPKQMRANHTRDLIFEATARIIEEQGVDALTTNSIAIRAGISIGTLYGHFANKEAILVSMARQLLACDEEAILRALSSQVEPGISRVRVVIHALIDLHLMRPEVRRAVMATHAANGFASEGAAVVRHTVERIVCRRRATPSNCWQYFWIGTSRSSFMEEETDHHGWAFADALAVSTLLHLGLPSPNRSSKTGTLTTLSLVACSQ